MHAIFVFAPVVGVTNQHHFIGGQLLEHKRASAFAGLIALVHVGEVADRTGKLAARRVDGVSEVNLSIPQVDANRVGRYWDDVLGVGEECNTRAQRVQRCGLCCCNACLSGDTSEIQTPLGLNVRDQRGDVKRCAVVKLDAWTNLQGPRFEVSRWGHGLGQVRHDFATLLLLEKTFVHRAHDAERRVRSIRVDAAAEQLVEDADGEFATALFFGSARRRHLAQRCNECNRQCGSNLAATTLE